MDVWDAIETRLEVRDYTADPIDRPTRMAILDAGRLAPSGKNLQHWRFVIVDDDRDLDRLAAISTTGDWIAGADFAVVVLTDPTYDYHGIDAGRAITYMQFAAWDRGVGSCIYTGYDDDRMRAFLEVPPEYSITAVIGFGRPTFDIEDVAGRKNRAPLSSVAYDGRYGQALDPLD